MSQRFGISLTEIHTPKSQNLSVTEDREDNWRPKFHNFANFVYVTLQHNESEMLILSKRNISVNDDATI